MKRIDGRTGEALTLMWTLYRSVMVKREAEAVDLPVDLCSSLHRWSRAVGCDRKNEIANTSGRNELPLKGGGVSPEGWGEERCHLCSVSDRSKWEEGSGQTQNPLGTTQCPPRRSVGGGRGEGGLGISS